MSSQNSLTMTLLRVWMWVVPIGILVVSAGCAAWAASDERWGLFAMMVFMCVIAVSMLVLHYWLLYRFGKDAA